MKLYKRYILRESIASVLLVLFALLALFCFFDMIGELKHVGREAYRLHHALMYVALRIPGRLYELIPIAVLIGSLYALSTLSRHSEITVLRASGLSTRKLLGLLLQMGCLFALVTLLIGEFAAPASERAAQQLKARALNRIVGQEFRSGLWLKDGRSFVNVKSASEAGELKQVRIYQFDDGTNLQSISEAATGKFLGDGKWEFTNVVRTVFAAQQAKIQRFPKLVQSSSLTPDILSVLMVSPERMPLIQLAEYTRHLSTNRQKTERYEIALWKKLFYPLGALVMVALALPFAYTHNRMGGVSLKIFGGVMTGILFHMLNGLFSSLGAIHSWPPLASAAAPATIFLMAALGLLWWVERR